MRRGTPAAIKFGEIIHNIRVDKKKSMRDVATKLGVAAATVSQSEKAQRVVKRDKLSKWAKALGVREYWLRQQWDICDLEPDPPIVRTRGRSVQASTLYKLILTLSPVDRNRVQGYVDALIEQQRSE